LDQNIQKVAILINGSPQIVNAAIDLKEHFIKMPLVPRPRRFSSLVVSINLAELEAPFSDRLIAESDTAHREHLFNIAEAQGEAEVQPNGMTDDLGRESMTMVRRDGGAHQSSMPHENLRLHLPLLS
jgi:hypothetical protein